METPTRALCFITNTYFKVKVAESGGHEEILLFSKKVKVVFPPPGATAKSNKGKCDLIKHQKAEDTPQPPN